MFRLNDDKLLLASLLSGSFDRKVALTKTTKRSGQSQSNQNLNSDYPRSAISHTRGNSTPAITNTGGIDHWHHNKGMTHYPIVQMICYLIQTDP